MTEEQKHIVGLDIGTTKIACIVGRKNEHGKIEIIGMGKAPSTGVSRGVVSNIHKTIDSIRAAVEEAEQTTGIEITEVNVGIAGQHIRSLQHNGVIMRQSLDDEITHQDLETLKNDMYKLVMPAGEEVVHIIPQDYQVDSEQGIKDPVGMAGIRLAANFHIIVGQVTAAKNIYKCVRNAGMEVSELVLEPLASSDSVLSEEEKEAGIVLVDIGGGTTDIAIFYDNIIQHTAVIPFGGNVVTEDIRQGCGIMRAQAEKLKQKFGSALAAENKETSVVCIPGLAGRAPKEISLKTLAEIIQSRMEEIMEHVHFEIKNSGLEKRLIGGIVLTGGGAQLKHLTHLTAMVTGMDCRIGYPTTHLAKSEIEQVTSPLFATGVGLVMRGIAEADKQLPNSLNMRERAEKMPGLFSSIKRSISTLLEDDE